MSNAKHTPGPWKVTAGSDWHGMAGVALGIDDDFGQDGGRDYYLATVAHGDPDVLAANARLLAAAPDMLAALKFIVAAYGNLESGAIDVAKIAIANAEGNAA